MKPNLVLANTHKPSPMATLEHYDRRIALESVEMSAFSNSLSSLIPKLASNTKNFFTSIKAQLNLVSTYETKEDTPELIRLLKKHEHNYASYLELGIYVPEGFNGDLAQYVLLLRNSVDHALSLVNNVITPYNNYLSSLVSSENNVKSTVAPVVVSKKINETRDHLNHEIGKHFLNGATKTRQPMGSVIKRMADWEIVFVQLNAINEALKHYKNETVLKAVDDCSALLDAVKNEAESKGFTNISPDNLRALSSSTLSIAREIEFYAVTRQRVKVLTVAMDDTVDFLKTILV